MTGKCSTPRCEYPPERMHGKSKVCYICYLERTASSVRKVQRTMKADSHTRSMFGGAS